MAEAFSGDRDHYINRQTGDLVIVVSGTSGLPRLLSHSNRL